MNNRNAFVAVATGMMVVSSAWGGESFEITAKDGFRAVTGIVNAQLERTAEALVFTEINPDLQLFVKARPMPAIDIESFEFRYRATGTVKHPACGGELYYAPLDAGYADARSWKLPPLVRDGQWHVMKLEPKLARDVDDWMSSGNVSRFRFDPTNCDGGRLEIAWIRFNLKGTGAGNKPAAGKFHGEDAWPAVVPETFKSGTVRRKALTNVTVSCRGGVAAPREQDAGKTVRLRYDYRGAVPDVAFLPGTVVIYDERGELVWHEEVTLPLEPSVVRYGDDVWALEFDYTLPLYVGFGRGIIHFESPCLRTTSGHSADARLTGRRATVDPAWPESLRSEVKDVAGSPCFAVDGEPFYPLWGTVANSRQMTRKGRHSPAPLNVVTVWTNHLKWWPKDEEFDPTDLDRLAEMHRRENPNAWFMWDISIYPPPSWRDANPREMALDEQGKVNLDCGDSEINFSFASKKAYDDMERILEKVIRHLESSPYANRIIGYRVNSGHTVEWLGWDPTRKETILDFSPVAREGFEAFAKAHYPWITDYSVPTLAERRALDGAGDVLWDQRKHARAIAFHDFYSTAVADGAIRMCRRAKELVGGRKLIGTYFGYVMTLNGSGRGQMRAHFATKRLLDAQATDFLMSPQNYSHCSRQPGSQISDMKPFASMQAHGIVPVIEDDTRTHNIVPVGHCQTPTEDLTVCMLRRNMGVSLCRNQPFYTYAITGGSEFDFPRFGEDAAALATAGAFAVRKGTRRRAEIAIVVSEEAVKSTPMSYRGAGERYRGLTMQAYENTGKVERFEEIGGPKNAAWPYHHFYSEASRVGAGIDYLLAEDVADHPGDYRLYVFQTCTKLTPALLKAAERLRERDCMILWTYAPGYTANEGNSVENMKRLTGMDFELRRDVTDPEVTLEDGRKVGGLDRPEECPPLAPIFAAVNPEKTLGRYANGAAGLAESRTGRARTVFSGSYYVAAPLLRTLAASAGVHLFSDSLDIVEANGRFVSFHARNAGPKTIRLPGKTDVVDVFNRRLVASGVESFTFEAPLHSSWLFCYGDDARELLKDLLR